MRRIELLDCYHVGVITSRPSATATASDERLTNRLATLVGPVVRPFVISRLAVLLMAVALSWLLDAGRAHRYEYIGQAPLPALSATFDANWYANIATEGYSRSADINAEQNYHFFPLYPLIMRVVGTALGLGTIAGGYNLAGVIVGHLLFLAALVALYRLTLRVFDRPKIASATVWVAAFAPWSFAYSMAYTESLFLLLSVLAVLFAYEARSDMNVVKISASALVIALAALTRPQGLLLAVPVVALMAFDGRQRSLLNRLMLAAAVAAPALLAVCAFVLYIGLRTGNLLALLEVNKNWGDGLLVELSWLFILPPKNPLWFVEIMSAIGLVVWAAIVFIQIRAWLRPTTGNRHLVWASLAYSLAYFTFTLLVLPTNSSWGRYMIVVYPNIMAIGQLTGNVAPHRARNLLALSLTLQVLLLAAAVLLQLTP
jgi:hypothetical protein